MRPILLSEYVVNLDAIDVVVVASDGAHISLRSGRTIYVPPHDARKLFGRLGLDYDLARLSAEEQRMRVAESDGEEWGEPWES